jgi:hypothetical protein
MSIACCCAAVNVIVDEGDITCDNCNGIGTLGVVVTDVDVDATDVDVVVFKILVDDVLAVVEILVCDFVLDEDVTDFNVEGLAGTVGGLSEILSVGAGIGNFLIGFFNSYGGGGGGGSLRAFGVLSIEFKMLSSECDREKMDEDDEVIGRGRNGGGGGGSYEEHKLATEGL